MKLNRTITIAVLVGSAVASQAVMFSNVIISGGPLGAGSSFSSNGNSISFFAPNAVIVDGVPVPSNVLSLQYDVMATNLPIVAIGANIVAPTAGSGVVVFTEQVIELDANGNEVGLIPGATLSHIFNPSGPSFFSSSINLGGQYNKVRVKKGFVLSAPNTTQGLDMAAVATINQSVSVVPEPATLAALGVGVAALLRRRKK